MQLKILEQEEERMFDDMYEAERLKKEQRCVQAAQQIAACSYERAACSHKHPIPKQPPTLLAIAQ